MIFGGLWALKAALTSLNHAPELSFEDFQDIKIPRELFDVLSLDDCRKLKVLPLRLDPKVGIFTFAFVRADVLPEIEKLKQTHSWSRITAYRISEETLNQLLNQLAPGESISETPDEKGWIVALIEPENALRQAFEVILRAQGYGIRYYDSEASFLTELKKLTSKLQQDEEELLNLAESRRLIPFQAILAREDALEAPKTFADRVWAQLGKMRISILDNRWFQPIFERSLLSGQAVASDFEFHLKHEDYYHAALESLKQGNLFQAVELLEQVQASNRYFLKAKITLGKAFLKKRNYNKATEHFQSAYDHWCEDPDAIVDDTVLKLLYHLAYAFEKLGRLDDALKLYERVAGENPFFKDVNARMAQVKNLQRKANEANEKKVGLPAFSREAREKSRYERIEEIGRGGMGIVYRARDRVLGREVALKVLNSHFKHDEKIVETFLREAKSLAALNHLHIVTIFDAGIEEGNYYIAMEFIEGKTVRELLKKKGHFKVSTALALARQVLKALAYAHSKRVIHRDITTNNMMLTESKIVKIMDFGLARVVNQLHSEQSIIGGTPYFMSPEQVEGAPIDHRTDIYSFGVCLYEMVTGQVTFPMENPGYHHLHTQAPDPRKIKPELPEELSRVILKCLEKQPDARFQSADQLIEALKKVPEEGEPTLAVNLGKKK